MCGTTRSNPVHGSTSAHLTRRSFLSVMGASLAAAGCAASGGSEGSTANEKDATTGTNPDDVSALAIDSAAWSYDADNDIYYQIGVPYCASPVAEDYESMGIYVPGAYFSATENEDGSFTCTVNTSGSVGNYTASTAPVVLPVNTAGYSAQAAPSSYDASGLTDYLSAGLIYVYAGCRGRDNGENSDGSTYAGGAPWGVTDLKAAIRCLRFNASSLPGDLERVFTFGHSGGGAQSALIGATGDAPGYTPYLEAIGALFTDVNGNAISDATYGAMCWCPITSLDVADEAYEWMMGQYADSGTRADGTWTALLSEDLAKEFVSYVNASGFSTEEAGQLTLSEGGEGTYAAGSYYDYLLSVIEGSLNNFLADTEFPYTPSSDQMADGGFGGGGNGGPSGEAPSGGAPDGAPSGEAPSGSAPDGAPSGEAPSGDAPDGASDDASKTGASGGASSSESTTYEDAQAYIDALNGDDAWISYDASTNTATVASIAAFARACKTPTKDVGAFDMLDRSSAENKVFGNASENALHFDATMATLLADNADSYAEADDYDDSYAEAYASDLESVDELGISSADRQNLYNPLYYLHDSFEGYGSSQPAAHWRIRTGIEQGDTSLTTEVNLALALQMRTDVSDVDFETVWGQGHTTAERTGSSTENLIAWIESCQ